MLWIAGTQLQSVRAVVGDRKVRKCVGFGEMVEVEEQVRLGPSG